MVQPKKTEKERKTDEYIVTSIGMFPIINIAHMMRFTRAHTFV